MPIAGKTIRDYRAPALWMALVGAMIGLVDVLIYPSYKDSLAGFEKNLPGIIEAMAGSAGSITSPAGFLNAEWFSWVPLLFITLAIIASTGATAGEEAAGTLDLLLAQPKSRRRILLEKAAAIAALIVAATMLSALGFLVARPFADIDIGALDLLSATFYVIPLILLFGALALWAGVTLPTRTSAAMATTGVVVAAYFLQLIGTQVEAVRSVRMVTPFYWSDASHVMIHGFAWARFGVLLAITAVLLGLAAWSFERRDIAAGRQEWSLRSLVRRPAPGAEAESDEGGRWGARAMGSATHQRGEGLQAEGDPKRRQEPRRRES